MKITFEKEIEINLYGIIEDWLRDMDLKATIVSHADAAELTDRIESEINDQLSNE